MSELEQILLNNAEKRTERESFLLRVIAYLDDMDCWYLDEAPEYVERLETEFGFKRDT